MCRPCPASAGDPAEPVLPHPAAAAASLDSMQRQSRRLLAGRAHRFAHPRRSNTRPSTARPIWLASLQVSSARCPRPSRPKQRAWPRRCDAVPLRAPGQTLGTERPAMRSWAATRLAPLPASGFSKTVIGSPCAQGIGLRHLTRHDNLRPGFRGVGQANPGRPALHRQREPRPRHSHAAQPEGLHRGPAGGTRRRGNAAIQPGSRSRKRARFSRVGSWRSRMTLPRKGPERPIRATPTAPRRALRAVPGWS